MKKTMHIATSAVLAVLAWGCTGTVGLDEPEGQEITVTATFAENRTKTTLQDGGTEVYWEPGDEVKLFYDGTGSRFASTCTAASRTSKFTGTMNVIFGFDEGFSDSTPLLGLYPYRSDATADNSSVTTTLPSEQTGKSGSFAKGMNLSLAKSTSLAMGFYNVCGGVRFSVTRADVTDVVFEALGGESVAGRVKLGFNDNIPVVKEVIEGEDAITLTAPGGGVFETGKWYYIVALPGTLSGGFKMTFNTATKYAVLKSTDARTVKRGKFGSLADADDGLIYRDKGTPEPEFVDLGLSVKWASFNVGATSPEGYGDHYACGEIDTKSDYSWSTYKYCNGSKTTMTKYCTSSDLGTVDNKTVLEPEDDVAHVKWGGSWRIPTDSEWTELMENCTWTWTTLGGVNGRLVTSNIEGYTDKSIFLPAAGGRTSYLYDVGFWGHYRSSSFYSDYSCYTWLVSFCSDDVNKGYSRRFYGSSVRPVYGEFIPVSVISVDQSELCLAPGYTAQLRAIWQPENATYPDIRWESRNQDVAIVSETGQVTALSTGICTITVYSSSGTKGVCTVTVPEPEPEYIDLGLSVKWATCNLGATGPEGYGDYYAWGETETKECYGFSTYKYCNGSINTLTKYCTSSSFGAVDNKTVLELEDDVAHMKLGGSWRMPTDAEWTELRDNCAWRWTAFGGVNGWLVTSNKENYTDRSIFLPAAGYRSGTSLFGVGSDGNYWSSFLRTDGSFCAWYLNFDQVYVSRNTQSRDLGQSVRPVSE